MHLLRLYPRLRPLAWLCACFLVVAAITRGALAWATGSGLPPSAGTWLGVFVIGAGYDLLTFVYFAWPLVLLLWLLPRGSLERRPARIAVGLMCFVLLAVLLSVAVAEWTFWDEFQTRFNFIAVDYLVYTTEVLGNIKQSYPVGALFAGIGALAVITFAATRRWRRVEPDTARFAARSAFVAFWLVLSIAGTAWVRGDLKDTSANSYVNELRGNGMYEFFAAYRHATLDYDRFYRRLPDAQAVANVRAALATPDATFLHPTGIERHITPTRAERRLNVVLVSVESFSADYSGTYGRQDSLTPNLDALTPDSLLFTRLYASGTRTVRGLEALALSVPPTPGESIVKREHNENLFSLGSVFASHGYASEFHYGGYGAFDNMNAFFADNGYDVHDRVEIPAGSIHHENVWGVADEDLYTLTLARLDRAHAAGRPLFAHVMTTSNHRPYTFPKGRGPWPQKDRISAVRYTDWALGDFIRRARSRPWFANTVFVITADHCAMSAGKAALPAFRYHIPMWVYSPGNVVPGRFEGLVGQVDIAPTLLGMLGFAYDSRFYGVDVASRAPARAFIGTYEQLGYLRDGLLVQLSPHQRVHTLRPAMLDDLPQPEIPEDSSATLQAVSFYQAAAHAFQNGGMRMLAQPAARAPATATATQAHR